MPRALCVVPARLESSRLPNKVLLDVHGKPLVVRTLEAALRCPEFSHVALVTDSLRVGQAAMNHFYANGKFPTPPLDVAVIEAEFPCGTDRVANYVKGIGDAARQWDVVVNLQADEPEIEPEALSKLVETMRSHTADGMATLVADGYPDCAEIDSEDHVQALTELERGGEFALEFSRDPRGSLWVGRNHIGAYAFTLEALQTFASLPQTPGETRNRLEQLRWLQHSRRIAVACVTHRGKGINTQEDYEALLERFHRD
jgi:3-deoxy-manno-octulosonate cytidylyltransferase (CMP-KDO synthetase)